MKKLLQSNRKALPILLFITVILTGVIVGFLVARRTRNTPTPSGNTQRFLEEHLGKADERLEQFSRQL